MRVVSLNVWGGRVYGPLMQFLKNDAKADVLCLQEVYDAASDVPESLVTKGSNGEFPARPHLFREIAALLPEHHGHYFPASEGYLHDGEMTEHAIRYGIATFVHWEFPIIRSSEEFVHGEYWHRADNLPPHPRNAHAVRIRDHDGTAVLVTHVHGLWVPTGKGDTPERDSQAQKLVNLVNRTMSPEDRVVVCGDFNVLPTSSMFHMLQAVGVRDLISQYDITDTRTSFYKKNVSRYADYMLVSDNVEISDFEVPDNPEVSDHRPLILDID